MAEWPHVEEGHGRFQRGMGRGLAALLATSEESSSSLRDIALELIRPNPHQPRQDFDGERLLALAESIKARGVLQPLVVRALPGGSYELVAGERRLRASKLAGLELVPAIVRETEESERLEIALIENMAREDLSPIEEARACATLVDDLGVTKEELGRRVGRSRVAISNAIRLLDLPDEAQAMLQSGELSAGPRPRALDVQGPRRAAAAGGRGPRPGLVGARDRAAREGRAVRGGERRGRGGSVAIHPDLAELLRVAEEELSAALGRGVRIRAKGAGCTVEFELDDPRDAVELAARIATDRDVQAA